MSLNFAVLNGSVYVMGKKHQVEKERDLYRHGPRFITFESQFPTLLNSHCTFPVKNFSKTLWRGMEMDK